MKGGTVGGYTNGRFPLSMFIHRGGNIYLTPSLNARWNEAVRIALEKYGVRLYITGDIDGLGGWNGYRPYDAQVAYKKHYGRFAAAPGYSSHGGIYGGRLVFAVDVANWQALGWARFAAIMRLVGLTTNFVTPEELWHVGDENDPWFAPTFGRPAGDEKPLPTPAEPEEEDDDMYKPTVHFRTEGNAEWCLGHPEIGNDLAPGAKRTDGKVTTFRGYMVTTDPVIGTAWARTHAKGSGSETSRTDRAGYIAIQTELTRVSGELA